MLRHSIIISECLEPRVQTYRRLHSLSSLNLDDEASPTVRPDFPKPPQPDPAGVAYTHKERGRERERPACMHSCHTCVLVSTSLSLSILIYIYTHMLSYMAMQTRGGTFMYVHLATHKDMRIAVFLHMYIYIYRCSYLCICLCTYTYRYMYVHIAPIFTAYKMLGWHGAAPLTSTFRGGNTPCGMQRLLPSTCGAQGGFGELALDCLEPGRFHFGWRSRKFC